MQKNITNKIKRTANLTLNMIMNMLRLASTMLFSVVAFPYISRVLEPEGTGKVQFAVSVVYYFSIMAQLGIPTYAIREISKNRNNKSEMSKIFQEIMIINIFTCVIVYILFFASILLIPKFHSDLNLFLVTGLTIGLDSLGIEWFYQGVEDYTFITIKTLICFVVSMVMLFTMVHGPKDYIVCGLIYTIAMSGSKLFNFVYLGHYISLKPFSNYNFKQHIKPILIFFMMSVAVTIYTNLDKVMLGFIANDTQVGFYSIAANLKTVFVMIVTGLSSVLLPRCATYIKNKQFDNFHILISKVLNLVLLVTIPLCLYLFVYADDVIYFAFGNSYIGSIFPFDLLVPTILFIGISNITGIQMLVPLGKEHIVLHSEICGAIVDFLLNFLWIPKYGALGASLSTLIAEGVVCIWQIVAIKGDVKAITKTINVKNILISNIVFFICILIFNDYTCKTNTGYLLNILFALFVPFTIYFVVLVLLKENLALSTINKIKNVIRINAKEKVYE